MFRGEPYRTATQWCGLLSTVLLTLAGGMTMKRAYANDIEYGGEEYQRRLLNEARQDNGLVFEPQPEGKIIERIVTVPFGVILPDEPYPKFLNWFHVTTLPQVIDRELLFQVGDPWTADKVLESARNMRNYLFLTSARIVACKGSTPNTVVVLVVTKDLWSLRTDIDFQYLGGQVLAFETQLSEDNLAGRMKRVTGDFGFDQPTYFGGLQYSDPRLLGSQVKMSPQGDLIWNRSTGVLEGGVANFTIQQPLYTLDTPWAWIGAMRYRKDIYRLYSSGQEAYYLSPTTGESIPYSFNRHLLNFQAGVTRSLGHTHKRDYSVGYRSLISIYSVPAQTYAVQQATITDFENSSVPLTESAGMIYASFHAYEADYRELIDIQSFAVTEDFHLGPDYSAELRLAAPVFGFSSTFFEPILNVGWSTYQSDDLFATTGSFDVRYQPQLNSANPWVNGSVTAGAKNVTPRFKFMRLHTQLRAGRRFNDYNHVFTTLGGDSYLRGYPQAYFIGSNFWVGNVEFRSEPIAWSTVHLGAAVFFDIGSAADTVSQLTPHESVGFGFRVGFPQFNHDVFRLDIAVPLETIVNGSPAYVAAQFGQTF